MNFIYKIVPNISGIFDEWMNNMIDLFENELRIYMYAYLSTQGLQLPWAREILLRFSLGMHFVIYTYRYWYIYIIYKHPQSGTS